MRLEMIKNRDEKGKEKRPDQTRQTEDTRDESLITYQQLAGFNLAPTPRYVTTPHGRRGHRKKESRKKKRETVQEKVI
ncbi:hypothetical protein E2C01_049213 [Portunus trituberculatus]|uniref:Uncharacterized protein n=1 Tax=Portunus trituberculatus TaxID=210409 RepID=A0A5B7G5K7_PORTR|nr:hypothetical protein [Portunus trituberculatus]